MKNIALLALLPFVFARCAPSKKPTSSANATNPDANPDPNWEAASNTIVTCSKTSDKVISFYVGPQLSTVLNDACAALMPACAYQDRVPANTVCTETIDFELSGARSSIQSANVEDATTGNKLSGWSVKFSVTPAATDPSTSPGVFWTKADCYGYFAHIVADQEPAGCHNGIGSGIGSATVGGTSSLAGSVFNIEIVKRQ